MKIKFPLYAQVLGVLFLHLSLLLILFFGFFNAQFGVGWEPLVYSPFGERVDAMTWIIGRQMQGRPVDTWNSVLESFGNFYGVKFYVFDARGHQLAGEPLTPPTEVQSHLLFHRPFPPGFDPRGVGPGKGAPDGFPFPPGVVPPSIPPDGREPLPDAHELLPGSPLHAVPNDPKPPVLDISQAEGGLPPGTVPPPRQLSPEAAEAAMNHRIPPNFVARVRGRFLLHTGHPDCYWIGARLHLRREQPATLLAVSHNLLQSRLFLDFGLFLASIAAILLLSVLIWIPFVFRVTRALSELTLTTEKISEGSFETSLSARGWDEIGSLTLSINRMAKKLNSFVTGQKRFLGDIAHELCSPVARLQVALEILEHGSPDKREQSIKDIREEVEEMSNLINELLAFSKAGLRGREMELSAVELEPLLQGAVAKICPSGLVTIDIPDGCQVLADQTLLERAVSNILRNAVRYAGTAGPINIYVSRLHKDVSIKITDCGPGVPEEAVRNLGEPFFRPEPSRSRSSGGVGLGLAIVKTCVEACNGKFAVRNRQPSGLEVEITLSACAKSPAHPPQPPVAVN